MTRKPELPPVVAALAKEYNIAPNEVWVVAGGTTCAIKHPAIERMAAQAGIQFGPPQVLEGNGESRIVSLMGTAKLGERVEWSIGEAAPYNNKNAYPWAIAEKRLKARLTLKLLAAHGYVYSEVDADDFKQPPQGDYEPPVEVVPIRSTPAVPPKSSHALKKDRPKDWEMVVGWLRNCQSESELKEEALCERFQKATEDWPPQWLELLREEEYKPMLKALRGNEVVWAG